MKIKKVRFTKLLPLSGDENHWTSLNRDYWTFDIYLLKNKKYHLKYAEERNSGVTEHNTFEKAVDKANEINEDILREYLTS